jgi:hypothetical protein
MPHLPPSSPIRPIAAAAITAVASLLALGAGDALAQPTAPPPVSILTSQLGNDYNQDFFITPTGDTSTYAQGPEILNTKGQVVWFQATPPGLEATDFRTQSYDGQPVLTWWQGTESGGVGNGTDYIYNDRYQQIATVSAANGLQADAHEFYITPQNTALITAYEPATADLSPWGPSDQKVVNGVVQEIDIATGQLLWQWNSAQHVPYSASEQPLPSSPSETWDWFHINAIHPNTNGDLLIDARNTWATYDVDPDSGDVNWTLGGKDSSFTLQAGRGQALDDAGEIFAWQHDPEPLGNGYYSLFDDEATIGAPALPYSRVVIVHLDQRRKVATLVASDEQPEGLSATSQGNAQPLEDGFGGFAVGWGALPYFSVFNGHGGLTFNAEFPTGVNTYRAYLLPWNPPSGNEPGGGGGPPQRWTGHRQGPRLRASGARGQGAHRFAGASRASRAARG